MGAFVGYRDLFPPLPLIAAGGVDLPRYPSHRDGKSQSQALSNRFSVAQEKLVCFPRLIHWAGIPRRSGEILPDGANAESCHTLMRPEALLSHIPEIALRSTGPLA